MCPRGPRPRTFGNNGKLNLNANLQLLNLNYLTTSLVNDLDPKSIIKFENTERSNKRMATAKWRGAKTFEIN